MTAIQTVRFPMTDPLRQLLLDVIDEMERLVQWHESKGGYGLHREALISHQEVLLNYLPEIQFSEDAYVEATVLGSSRMIKRQLPNDPVMYAIGRACDFETRECEITCLLARYREIDE